MRNTETTGMPCGLFFSWDEPNAQSDMAAAIPTAVAEDLGQGYTMVTLPAGKALLVNYYGDYSGMVMAHDAIAEYASAHSMKTGFPVIEQYVTDPGEEPDPSKWLTRVFYPLESD